MPIDFTPISLDIETSTDSEETGTILSIGLVHFFSGEQKEYNIRHELLTIQPKSMRVNQIDVLEVDNFTRFPSDYVDSQLNLWLEKLNYPKPVGMNIATFDMRFVRKYLPRTASIFGYRSIDINALIFAESIKQEKDFRVMKGQYKSYAKDEVSKRFGRQEHDALFDALVGCYVLAQILNIYPEWMNGWRAGATQEEMVFDEWSPEFFQTNMLGYVKEIHSDMLPNLRSPSDWNWFDGVRYWLAGKILGKRLWQEYRAWQKEILNGGNT